MRSAASQLRFVIGRGWDRIVARPFAQSDFASVVSERFLRTAAAMDHPNERVARAWAEILLERGQFAATVEFLTLPEQQKGKNVGPRQHLLGRAYMGLGRCSRAEQAFRTALEENPHAYWTLTELGIALMQQGRPDEAQKAYRSAIEIAPQFSWAHFHLANSLFAGDDYDGAALAYLEAIRLDPKQSSYYRNCYYSALRPTLTANEQLQALDELAERYPELDEPGRLLRFLYKMKHADASLPPPRSMMPDRGTLPEAIIIGQLKGGTTSLLEYIVAHPSVLPPRTKETSYWNKNADRDLSYYRAYFPPVEPGSNYITIEATPGYFVRPEVPPRLRQALPDVKLILLIRDPVECAFSHYRHNVRRGGHCASWSDLVEIGLEAYPRCPLKRGDPALAQGGLLTYSIALPHLREWLSVFPREQLLVLRSEALFADPQQIMHEVYDFLDLRPHSLQTYKVHHAGPKARMDLEVRRKLREYYRPYQYALEDFLDMPFPWGENCADARTPSGNDLPIKDVPE